MAKEKKSFIVYQSWREPFDLLTEKEKAQFITNLFKFNNDEEITLDTPMLKMFWTSIEYNLSENDKRYQTSKTNGAKGGAPKGNKNAIKQPNQPNSTEIQPKQLSVEQNNLNDNVNVNDNVNDNVKENVNENAKVNVNEKLVHKLIDELHNADKPSDIENILNDLEDVGWSNVYSALDATEDMKKKLRGLVQNKQIILETA